ncbi:MAG TPA: hypothetical protein VGK38_01380, partial [Prolixibacteraceae bacterium]
MKKTLLLLFAFTLFLTGSVFSQTINATSYYFNVANSSMPVITATQLIGPNSDNVASAVTPIGFNFYFAGTLYTQFSVSENGLMTLGSTQISGADVVNDMGSGITLPKIAPYWDDLTTGTNGSVGYQVTGTAPNRVLIVKWNVTVPKNIAAAANTTFWAQIYEQGSIYFSFINTAFPVNTAYYTMGIGASSTDFASVTVNSSQTFSTIAYGASYNLNGISPATITQSKRYQFSADNTAPSFTTETIPNSFGTANRTITNTIRDQTPFSQIGVPTSGSLVPR